MITSIAAAVVILALLIIVHEAGHFAMAKRLGVRVLRFSIGYPPKVWGLRRGETEYAIGATPFGGYVRMLGEEVGEEPASEELQNYIRELALDVLQAARRRGWKAPAGGLDEALPALAEALAAGGPHNALRTLGRELRPEEAAVIEEIARRKSVKEAREFLAAATTGAVFRSFRARAFPTQKLWKRVTIVLAGPLANILFAPVLMTAVFLYGVPVVLPIVGQVNEKMPAYSAGLRVGDRILAVDGAPMGSWAAFSRAVKTSRGAPLRIELERSAGGRAERMALTIKPARKEERAVYGATIRVWVIGVLPRGDQTLKRYGPVGALVHGAGATAELARNLIVGLAQVASGATPAREALGGPIMIARMAGREAHEGLANLLMFTVMLSLELGILNLLPVPLLDGGHLLFFLFEGVRGKPLKLRYREIALQIGLLLLVALMAFVIFNDISHIAQG